MAKTTWEWTCLALKFFTLIGCTCLFVLMSLGIFNQYLNKCKVTSFAKLNTPSQKFNAPVIVICHAKGFINQTAHMVTPQDYLDNTFNITDMIISKKFLSVDKSAVDEGWDTKELFTGYAGRCAHLKYKGKVGPLYA